MKWLGREHLAHRREFGEHAVNAGRRAGGGGLAAESLDDRLDVDEELLHGVGRLDLALLVRRAGRDHLEEAGLIRLEFELLLGRAVTVSDERDDAEQLARGLPTSSLALALALLLALVVRAAYARAALGLLRIDQLRQRRRLLHNFTG